MRTLGPALFLVLVAACAEPTRCGPGTSLVDGLCTISQLDAGADGGSTLDGGSAELPISATVDAVTVLEGFAACPAITVAWRDGRSAKLLLDPDYAVPVRNAVHLASAGFSVAWQSVDGKTGNAMLPSCQGAITGLAPGRSTAALRVTNAAGASAVIGNVAVEVVSASGITVRPQYLALRGPDTFPSLGRTESALAVGEERSVVVSFDFTLPPGTPAGVVAFPIPDALTVTSSDESILAVRSARVRGVRAGVATVTAGYRLMGSTTNQTSQAFTVTDEQTPSRIVFGLPLDDGGFFLPDANRTLEQLEVGQCFTTSIWGAIETTSSVALRSLDQVATVSLVGNGLSAPGGLRFCAVAEGEGAVRACHAGRCGVLATVVVPAQTRAPTVVATVTPDDVRTGAFGQQRLCLAVRVMATWGAATPVDVSSSPAVRFAAPFNGGPVTPLHARLDAASGLAEREQDKTCFDVEVIPNQPDSGFRVFFAGGQSEVRLKLRF